MQSGARAAASSSLLLDRPDCATNQTEPCRRKVVLGMRGRARHVLKPADPSIGSHHANDAQTEAAPQAAPVACGTQNTCCDEGQGVRRQL